MSRKILAAVALLAVALLFAVQASWSRPRGAPRAHVEPLVLVCDDRQYAQAAAAARWPDELRRRPSVEGARTCVAVGAGVEFFPQWDAVARRPRGGDLLSHRLRHRQRALAWAFPCGDLPVGSRDGVTFSCPDSRLLVGSEQLVALAGSLVARGGGACLCSFRLGLWMAEAGLELKVLDEELAYVPAADGADLDELPTPSEVAFAVWEVGNGDVVLPSLGAAPDASLLAGWAA